jgi:hypothetical protein
MKRILVAAVLGAFVMFIWGWISWAMLPWHNTTIPGLPNEDVVMEALKANITASAVYQFPGMPDPHDTVAMRTWTEKYMRGPSGVLFYTAEGRNPMPMGQFVTGFLLSFVEAFLAAWLLSLAAGRLPGYGQRVGFIAVMGVLGALVSHIAAWNWMAFPTGYSLVMALDLVITSTLAGLVIAWRIKPAMAT